MKMKIYIRTYTFMHAPIHPFVRTYLHACLYACLPIYITQGEKHLWLYKYIIFVVHVYQRSRIRYLFVDMLLLWANSQTDRQTTVKCSYVFNFLHGEDLACLG